MIDIKVLADRAARLYVSLLGGILLVTILTEMDIIPKELPRETNISERVYNEY